MAWFFCAAIGLVTSRIAWSEEALPRHPAVSNSAPAAIVSTEEDVLPQAALGDIIVAIDDMPSVTPAAGATPRLEYRLGPGYAGGARSAQQAALLARKHGLTEVAAWYIAPLRWRCMVYRTHEDAESVLRRLAQDPRVRLVQPLQLFQGQVQKQEQAQAQKQEQEQEQKQALAEHQGGMRAAYNDPYVDLQRGFQAIHAAQVHRLAQGRGVRVAVIDTGIDASHAELVGRVQHRREFVAIPMRPQGERHGTQVAGVIAATAHNGMGIVGVAPMANLLGYRACWPVQSDAEAGSRCDTITLAQALAAAIDDKADIVNLSLAGPSDPLLSRLVERAVAQGIIVVGAMPPGGRKEGFPTDLEGVWAVGQTENAKMAPDALYAPGREVLTLEPGGHYGFASGSSMAAAHVSGAAALLKGLLPDASAAQLKALLLKDGAHGIDLCAASGLCSSTVTSCRPLCE